MSSSSRQDDNQFMSHVEPIGVSDRYPLTSSGSIDDSGNNISSSELLAHAFYNTASPSQSAVIPDVTVHTGGLFVNKYPRLHPITRQRFEGTPHDPNHLLGCFPHLFPYGYGGVETDQTRPVSYEYHIRWALRYYDRRFRLDHFFIFMVFGVVQKRRICRSASLQIEKRIFRDNWDLFQSIQSHDFLIAAKEEESGGPISNPWIPTLKNLVPVVRGRVPCTDECKSSLCGQIWGTIVEKTPPNVWLTLNP